MKREDLDRNRQEVFLRLSEVMRESPYPEDALEDFIIEELARIYTMLEGNGRNDKRK